METTEPQKGSMIPPETLTRMKEILNESERTKEENRRLLAIIEAQSKAIQDLARKIQY